MVIIRGFAGGNRDWKLVDNKRAPVNPIDHIMVPNTSANETTLYGSPVDFLSNGFKLRSNETNFNEDGANHIYMAWAEMPFKYANAR